MNTLKLLAKDQKWMYFILSSINAQIGVELFLQISYYSSYNQGYLDRPFLHLRTTYS